MDKIKKWYIGLNLKKRIQLLFISLSILPLLLLGWYSYAKTNQIAGRIISEYSQNLISEIDRNMTSRFNRINEISKGIVDSGSIRRVLSMSHENFDRTYEDSAETIRNILHAYLYSNEYINRIIILPENYEYIFYVESPHIDPLGPEFYVDYKNNKYYSGTINAFYNTVWWANDDISSKTAFYLTRKFYDSKKGIQGIIVMEISNKIMDDMMKIADSEQHITLHFVNQSNVIAHSTDPASIGKTIDKQAINKFSSQPSASFVVENNGVKNLFVYSIFFAANWKLVAITPYSAVASEITSISYFTLIIMAVFTVITLFASTKLAESFYDPIEKLITLMEKGASGELKVRFNAKYDDDIGKLGNAFDNLMDNINELIERIKYEQNQKARAEIRELEAQINPHFLYNTLASIYWAAREKENNAAQMALSLSNHLRLGLNKGNEYTNVENEVQHVYEYLRIQKLRFSDRLEYRIDVEEEIKQVPCIKFILQPLVENSIIHGMQDNDYICRINVRVFRRDEHIIFSVEDNGAGIPDLEEKGFEYYVGKGVGLKNLARRLDLYYDNYNFSCESNPNISTVFMVAIPLSEGTDEVKDKNEGTYS